MGGRAGGFDRADRAEAPAAWNPAELDLHGFKPRDLAELLREHIAGCVRAGRVETRIVHGRGTGALARGVHAELARLPGVDAYGFATPVHGGFGATWVRLKARTKS